MRRVPFRGLPLSAACASLVVLVACTPTATPPTPSPRPSVVGSQVFGPVELRPVISVTQPGAVDSQELANRLGNDVFYADVNGDGSFTAETDPLYQLGDPFIGAGDFVEARALPPTGGVNQWRVTFQLTDDAANRLEAATQRAVDGVPPQDQIAVVVKERVIAAPIVKAAISSGSGTVAMPSREEAERLAELMTQGA